MEKITDEKSIEVAKDMLEKLTAEQEVMIPIWRDKWIAQGLRTGKTDFRRAKIGIRQCYKIVKLNHEIPIVIVPSPIVGAFAASIANNVANAKDDSSVWASVRASVRDSVWASIRDSVGASVGASVRDSVWDSVGASVWDSVWDSARDSVRDSVWDSVGDSVGDSVRDSVWDSVGDSVRDSVWASIRASVWASVGDSVWDSVGDSVGDSVWAKNWGWHDLFYGQFDAGFQAWVSFFTEVCKVRFSKEENKKLTAMLNISCNCSFWWANKNFAMVCGHPKEIHKSGNVLHNEHGLAISWEDGWGLYCLNGVRVPKEIVMTPREQLDAHILLKEQNAEVRREIVRKIGIEKVCKDLGAAVLDTSGDYELLNINIGDNRIRPYLKMKNPSIGVYHIEGVHPSCKTVQEALNWRNNSEEKVLKIS